MGSEWPKFRFEELLEIPLRNGIYKKKEFHGSGAQIVNMGELFAYPRLFNVPMKRVELNDKDRKAALLKDGDLLFARRSLTAEGAGKCSIVKKIDEETTFESSLIRARPDRNRALPDYLYYFFSSRHGKYLIGTILRQVAVSGITGSDLKQLPIPLPPLSNQKAVSELLSTLDDKIDLNRQINTTLESMAQALFKSWFVDFDPVIDNALAAGNPIPKELKARADIRAALGDQRRPLPEHIRQQFPDRFVMSDELGWVPEGWEAKSLESIVDLIGGGTPKTSIDEYWGGDIPWFSVVDAPTTSDVFVTKTEKSITKTGLDNSSAKLLRKGTTIISARGTVGKCAMVANPMAMNQSCYGVLGKGGYADYFIYYTIFLRVADLQQRSHGSVFSTITRNTFKTIKIPACPPSLTDEYEAVVKSFMERILKNNLQSESLAKLRDTLLPKLLSGELQVPDVEKQIAERA